MKRTGLVLISLIICCTLAAQSIAGKLDALVSSEKVLTTSEVGISVFNLTQGKQMYAYQDKKQLVLMDITIPKGCYCADFSMLLNEYKKSEEKEILLPPYLSFDCHVLEKPLKIQNISDGEGNPVKIYCHMDMKGFDFPVLDVCDACNEKYIQAAKRVYAPEGNYQTYK